jgi:uncharacterized protein (TIGR03435 family)
MTTRAQSPWNAAMRTRLCAILPLCVVVLTGAQGTRSFDAASIRQNKSGDPGVGLDMSRGQLRATNVPLQVIIRQAFEVMDSQIVDAPAWVASDRYDIIAKAPDGVVSAEAMRPLMRALLADRFKLVTRTEKREMPVYALVKSRSDGGFGSSFRQSALDCAASQQAQSAPPAAGTGKPDEWPDCAVTFSPGAIYIGGYRISEVTRLLSPLVGRTVIDATGVTGPVQIRLQYQPAGRGASAAGAATGDRPDLFTAIQEQAGLRLEPRRSPVDVLVIDRIERPTED